jgi:N-acetylmuramoyl-L-alanine amidase
VVLKRILFAALLLFLAGGAHAQEAKPLLVGGEVLEAVYPGGFGVSYAEAHSLAKALGLSYWRDGNRLILGLGALRVRLPVSAVPKSRTALKKLIVAKPSHALKDGDKITVPLRYVARSLGCV